MMINEVLPTYGLTCTISILLDSTISTLHVINVTGVYG
jgi:hypothetical protein